MNTKLLPLYLFFFTFYFANAQNKYHAGRLINSSVNAFPSSTGMFCDTIFSFPVVSEWPSGFAQDGTNFWVADDFSNTLFKYSLNGQLIDSIELQIPLTVIFGGDLDYDGTSLWHVHEESSLLLKIDPSNGTILTQFPLYSTTSDYYGCAYDAGFVWTTEYSSRSLMRIDATTGHMVDSFFTGQRILAVKVINGDLYGIGFDQTLTNGQLYHIDKSNGTILSSMPWCLDYPTGFCSLNNYVWGLSSYAPGIGTKKIYRFERLVMSNGQFAADENFVPVFPNPFSDVLNISLPEKGKFNLDIYDITGDLQKHLVITENTSVDLRELSGGTYFYELSHGDFVSKGRLIKL